MLFELLTLLAVAPPLVPSILVDTTALAAVEPVRDVMQYPVGVLRRRWRCDYLLTTFIHGRDTLCFQATNSEVEVVKAVTILPETALVDIEVSVLRFEQDQHGKVIRGPKVIHSINADRLNALDVRYRDAAPNPATFPRRHPIPVIRSDPQRRPTMSDLQFLVGPNGSVIIDVPRYTALLYRDTLTSSLLGTEQEEAMERLGYTITDSYDLTVEVTRYIVNPSTGALVAAPMRLPSMTKAQFDERRVEYTKPPMVLPSLQ